jgi:hypothetical protein
MGMSVWMGWGMGWSGVGWELGRPLGRGVRKRPAPYCATRPAPTAARPPEALRFAQADAVDDGCMVELIADDRVLRRQQGLKEARLRAG